MKHRFLLILIVLFCCSFGVSAQMSDSLFNAQYGQEQLKDSTKHQRFDYHFYEGLRYFQNNEFRQAIDEFHKCMDIELTAEVYYELSRCYLQLNDAKRAFELIKHAVEMSPKNVVYKETLSGYYMGMRNYKEAMKVYEELYKINPSSVSYLYNLIGIADVMQNYKKMLFYLSRLEEVEGYSQDIAFARMNVFGSQNESKKIEAEFKKLIKKFPNEVYYKVSLGDFYMEQGDTEEALKIYESVLNEKPNNGYALISLSNYYRLKNQQAKSDSLILLAMEDKELPFDEKIDKLRPMLVELIQTDKYEVGDSILNNLLSNYGYEIALHELHIEYLNTRADTAGIIKEFQTLIELDNEQESYYFSLLEYLWNDKYVADMLELCTKAEEQFHSLSWGYYRVLALILNDKEEEAMLKIDSLMQTNPDGDKKMRSILYGIQGDHYMSSKKMEEAFILYDKALELFFDNASVLNNYAYCLANEKRDLRKAEKMAARSVELQPENVNFLDTYAWVLFMREDYRMARFYMERALAKEESAGMYDHYGDILFKLGEVDKAVEMWEKAVELGLQSEVINYKIRERVYIYVYEK